MILTLACIGSFCLGWVLCGAFGRESRLAREAELARAKELTQRAGR